VKTKIALGLMFAVSAQAQTKLDAERQIAPTSSSVAGKILVWLVAGPVRVANLDETQFEITASPTGVPTLRLKGPPPSTVKEKAVKLSFSGGPITLPDTPLAGTVVKVFWNGLHQDPTGGGGYSISGAVITPTAGNQWSATDTLVVVYFH